MASKIKGMEKTLNLVDHHEWKFNREVHKTKLEVREKHSGGK
jgi:hypothetical protein